MLRHSGHDIVFDPKEKTESCSTKPLTKEQADQFIYAVQHRWFYQMYLDDLPVWGMVGELEPKSGSLQYSEKDDLQHLENLRDDVTDLSQYTPKVYTVRNMLIKYNGAQIVQVDLHSDNLQEVKEGASLTFELRVQWEATTEEFHSRFERYLDHEFFKHPIHWFSVFNSFMMVLFLMGLVARGGSKFTETFSVPQMDYRSLQRCSEQAGS